MVCRIESVADFGECLLIDHPTVGYSDREVESVPPADASYRTEGSGRRTTLLFKLTLSGLWTFGIGPSESGVESGPRIVSAWESSTLSGRTEWVCRI